MSKATRLTIRLGEDVRAWLKAQGEQLGLDEAAFARMLLYEAKNGRHAPAFPAAAAALGPVADAADSFGLGAGAGHDPIPVAVADEERAEEIDVAPDADGGDPEAAAEQLDALMQAGPTFLDELVARAAPRQAAPARQPVDFGDRGLPRFQRMPARQPQQPMRQAFAGRGDHRRAFGVAPGSQTRAIGVNQTAANMQGDGVGNVQRDNNRHLGFRGTQSR